MLSSFDHSDSNKEGADQNGPASTTNPLGTSSAGAVRGNAPGSEDEGKVVQQLATQTCGLQTLEDADLMTRVAAGDEDAINVILERYRSFVFHIALAILKDRGEAQDTVQDAFLEVCRTADRFDHLKGSLSGWLFLIASHAALNRKEYLQTRQFYTSRQVDESEEAVGPDENWQHLAPQEQMHLARELLAKLKPAQRKAIELKFFEGRTAADAARRVGGSASTIENNVYRGLKKLSNIVSKRRK
jgi:RNA polymerase sigma-70 factor (ECF subfamily)